MLTLSASSSRCRQKYAPVVLTTNAAAVLVSSVAQQGGGSFDRFLDPVAGLADAGDVFRVVEGDFDGPAGGVAGDDLRGGRVHVGGDDGDLVCRLLLEKKKMQAQYCPPRRRALGGHKQAHNIRG